MKPSIAILGIRGVPASHGGFETFAQRLALYLTERGWLVTVYCQTEGISRQTEDEWQGVRRIHVPSKDGGGRSSMVFDWKAIADVARRRYDLTLTLGYNTAVFCARLRMHGITNLLNMDGIEWARAKWGWATRCWFYVNDILGCRIANHLIADHPEIRSLLLRRVRSEKISVICYGADALQDVSAEPLRALGLEPGRFVTIIARPEPENSVLEMVRAFCARPRGVKLVVLGKYAPWLVPLHAEIRAAADDSVLFPGAIYDEDTVKSLRWHCLLYMHGHRVGGTNPSLVEALGAGNPVLAHDNRFNRWVAQDAAAYFSSSQECGRLLDELLADPVRLQAMSLAARRRHAEEFTWAGTLAKYEALLRQHLPEAARPPQDAFAETETPVETP